MVEFVEGEFMLYQKLSMLRASNVLEILCVTLPLFLSLSGMLGSSLDRELSMREKCFTVPLIKISLRKHHRGKQQFLISKIVGVRLTSSYFVVPIQTELHAIC